MLPGAAGSGPSAAAAPRAPAAVSAGGVAAKGQQRAVASLPAAGALGGAGALAASAPQGGSGFAGSGSAGAFSKTGKAVVSSPASQFSVDATPNVMRVRPVSGAGASGGEAPLVATARRIGAANR